MKERIILIRPMIADDVVRSADIWLRASKIAHGFLGHELLEEQLQLMKDIYLMQAENWVLVSDDHVMGFVGLIDNFIGGLFVDPDFQGQGFGLKLLQHAQNLKKQLELQVYERNQQAVNFYLKYGFEIIQRDETDDDGLPFVQLTMVLKD
ncbi:GNAT family N-acetyltransferase [Paenochrobactrum sp. BZR 588]|uniref:GNAT family N-acetyltransferase n=1 Tax=Paenochrobactrum TaxID=999488 RepID=UPI0035BC24C8